MSNKPSKLKVYATFTKFRLSFIVILSAVAGYFFAGGNDLYSILYLTLGGALVTAASNGANQIIEKDLDALMKRTANRPLPSGTMKLQEAYWICFLSLIIGLALLFQLNFYSFALGLLAFISYVFAYTPLKQKSSWAVFVGAFPGAIPPMLGYIAHTNDFDFQSGILFFVQFTWQFPHFWAIAWVLDDDYKKAGFSLLPSKSGRGKVSAFQIMLYSLFLIPFSLMPWLLDWTGNLSLFVAAGMGLVFFGMSYQLFLNCEIKTAKKLMFASFVYLPILQFIYVLDKI